MNSEKEILDNHMWGAEQKMTIENRLTRNLLTTLAIFLICLGTAFLVILVYSFNTVLVYLNTNALFSSYFSWGRWILTTSLPFLYICFLIIGGIGLLRRKIIGWISSLTVIVFGILNIGFVMIEVAYSYNGDLGLLGWVLFAIVLLLALMAFFLLSKPIRDFFQPTLRSYGIAGVIIVIFALDLTSILLYV